jgi:hypothetical protein
MGILIGRVKKALHGLGVTVIGASNIKDAETAIPKAMAMVTPPSSPWSRSSTAEAVLDVTNQMYIRIVEAMLMAFLRHRARFFEGIFFSAPLTQIPYMN